MLSSLDRRPGDDGLALAFCLTSITGSVSVSRYRDRYRCAFSVPVTVTVTAPVPVTSLFSHRDSGRSDQRAAFGSKAAT
jgi:hypothetical protein